MDFRLKDGPWKEMFKGNFEGYDVEIYSNPESIILVSILEKEGGKVKGSVVEVYKVFHAVGELEGFVETLPREVITITKHDEKETTRFFILGSKPSYVEYDEEKFAAEVEANIKNLRSSVKTISAVSKAYDLQLQELEQAPEQIKQAFFSQPLIVPLLSTSSHIPSGFAAAAPAGKAISFGELMLGITREQMGVKEPLSLFSSTVVSGGRKEARAHMLHLLIEGALLSNIPAVVIDWNKRFKGLGVRTTASDDLKSYKVDIEPIGFPTKEFFIPQQLRVDLGSVNRKGLLELFGLDETIAGKEIMQVLDENRVASLAEVSGIVKARQTRGEFNEFQRSRAARILKLMDLRYPELFDGENNIAEISKSWLHGLGRAGIVNMGGHDKRVSLIMLHCIIHGLLEHYKKQGPSAQLRSMIIIPQVESIIGRNENSELAKTIIQDLNEMQQYGVGNAVSVAHEIDLQPGMLDAAKAKVKIVQGNDVGVQLKGRKNYRVLLRPGLSACTELVETR